MIVGVMEEVVDQAIYEHDVREAMYTFRRISRDSDVSETIRTKAAKLELKARRLSEMISAENDSRLKESFAKIKEGNYLH